MIDVSAFMGTWPFRPLPGSMPRELLALLSAEGVEKALVSPIEAIFYDEPQVANEKLCEAIRDFPALMPVAVLNPKLSNWQKSLDICCKKYHIRGVKLHPNYHRYDLGGDDVRPLLQAAGGRNMPVIIQLRVQDVRAQNPLGSAPDVDIADAIHIAHTHSGTRFVIGGIKWGEAQGKAKEILSLPNLWIEVSNIEYTDGLRRLIGTYGTKQLLFGTHAPFFVVRSAILKLQEADLSEEERHNITNSNISDIFGV